MAVTPKDVALDLLRTLRNATQELPHKHVPVDSRTLLLGIAEMLGDLCAAVPEEVRHQVIQACLQRFVSRVPGGELLVVRRKSPAGNGEDES